MNDTSSGSDLCYGMFEDYTTEPLTPDQEQDAMAYVSRFAKDEDDEQELLEMLGLVEPGVVKLTRKRGRTRCLSCGISVETKNIPTHRREVHGEVA